MVESQTSLLPFYKGWDTYQELLIKALEPLTLDQLSLRPVPQLHSIGENAAHIITARAGWLHYVLGRGDERLAALANWDWTEQPASSISELISGLEATWLVIQETLSHWSSNDLAEIVHDTDDDGEDHTYTRQWVLWHLIEHDLHHGGELSFTLGMYGLAGIEL